MACYGGLDGSGYPRTGPGEAPSRMPEDFLKHIGETLAGALSSWFNRKDREQGSKKDDDEICKVCKIEVPRRKDKINQDKVTYLKYALEYTQGIYNNFDAVFNSLVFDEYIGSFYIYKTKVKKITTENSTRLNIKKFTDKGGAKKIIDQFAKKHLFSIPKRD